MPPDLFRFRMFAGALSAFVTAIPVSLTCFLTGIDSFSRKSLTLTPTRLIVGVRTFYFLYFSKAYAWDNLLSASVEMCKGKNYLVLSFLGSRVVRINLDVLESKQRATLIQGLDELAPSCRFSNEVKSLFDRTREESVAGYTLFWDDELAKQRKSTVFVPLEQGAKLKGGDLEILRQLSGQGWSCTYLARYNGDFVVVRESVLSDETSSGKRALETLEKEARILSSLNHNSVAKVLDFFVEKQRSYLMLEYVVGLDLRKKIGMVGSVDEQRAIEIGIEVCNILQYLHGREPQVLHRDISPDNLVLTADGQLRLIDFAAAKQFVENATGTMIGKRSYMAPEQLRGKASVRSDIYSAGATLYFLLTGMDPIALSECEVLKHRPEVSPELDLLIRTMTNFEENNRPETIAAVRESLQSILKQRSSTGSALLRNLRSTLLEHDGFKLKVDSREKEQCK
ncbi:MAG: serine/threonine protein kinase [Candidatus Obscuribacterales bacterium]|nr:serine/threonine protein kinase [Candidatus Obscuribacterales bacterium]